MVKPVTPELAVPVAVTIPVPAVVVHTPVPGDGTVAAKVVVVELQTDCAVPAFDVTGDEDVIITDVLDEQAPLVIVHVKIEDAPMESPVTPELKVPGAVIAPAPIVFVQRPVPGDGLLPAKVAVVALHIVCATPAFATIGVEEVIVIVLVATHAPLVTVHWNVDDAQTVSPVTPELAVPVAVTTPVPAVVVHKAVPTDGVVAAKVAVVKLQIDCAEPALEVTGLELVIVTLELVTQAPLVTVQRNVEAAPTVSPVTPEVSLLAVVTIPVPDVVVHAPVPGEALLPAKVAVVELQILCAEPAFDTTGTETVKTAGDAEIRVPQAFVTATV